MKNHVKKKHEDKDILCPQRKSPKTDLEEDKTETILIHESENVSVNNTEGKDLKADMVTIEREQLKNLQDLLLQTGRDKELLTTRIVEWQNYLKQVTDKLQSAEASKKQVLDKFNHLKALKNTSQSGKYITFLKCPLANCICVVWNISMLLGAHLLRPILKYNNW